MSEELIECNILLDKMNWTNKREKEIVDEMDLCPPWRIFHFVKLNKKFNALHKMNLDNFDAFDAAISRHLMNELAI